MAAPMVQQSPNQNVPSQGQQQQVQANKEVEIDPIALMNVSGKILRQNSLLEEGHKPQEGLQQMFERSIEEFYSICDQLEANLRLALEMQAQQTDSTRYTPLPVTIPKSDNSGLADQQSIPYPQFLVTVKQQIACAKDMYELLADFTKKLSESQR
ncbi:MED29-like protein [Mya arenaria]|uniref:Mediator of RNA polymerase II transcription subunit 29 n=1 Tax=Mya arenaria TaxID=6604 RepID=A0ABY7FDC6_MYAAR|nr:MED29-like protein [Mya arenaria]